MGRNLFSFLNTVRMAHGDSVLTTADYQTTLLKQGQFHVVATETKTLYDILTIMRGKETVPLHVTRLDELCISPSVKTEKKLQVLSPELVMYVLCKRTTIATTSAVYNEKELDNA